MANAVTPYRIPAQQALTPEVLHPEIRDVEALARWLDYAFELPGGFRFGAAGIIGLIPGIGDLIDALISMYIVIRAVQVGVSKATLTRMLLNVGIESLAGAVPFAGDLFDVVYKANKRNYVLLKDHLREPDRRRSQDSVFLVCVFVGLALALVLPILAIVEIARHL